MDFYYPLTLGRRRPRRPPDPKSDAGRSWTAPEVWREGLGLPAWDHEKIPEARLFETVRQAAPTADGKFWLILGEPGCGKSTLFQEWFKRWWAGSADPAPRLGLPVPVLVRLRELPAEALDETDADALAERLWRHGLGEAAALPEPSAAVRALYGKGRGRLLRPVWLLDGLDEVPAAHLTASFFPRLAALPGLKLVSCRSAVYESLRPEADRARAPGHEYDLLGLEPPQQREFLAVALPLKGSTAAAATLHACIGDNPALAPLAGNPLLLDLIAEVADRIELPASRAEFYAEAEAALRARKLFASPVRHQVAAFEAALTALAARMGLETIEAPQSWWSEACPDPALADAVERTGLIRVSHRRGKVSFLHLTFQEYHLADALLRTRGLPAALTAHWDSPRHEETLALLLSRRCAEPGGAAEIDRELCALIEWGLVTHKRDRRILWEKRRSPMRTVLHLVSRAGLDLELLSESWGLIKRLIGSSCLCKSAAATDNNSPSTLLAWLAMFEDNGMRKKIAVNNSTPPGVLFQFSQRNDIEISVAIAKNITAPSEALMWLAINGNINARISIALNTAAPADVLAYIAQDSCGTVRSAVASNVAMPEQLLALLSKDIILSVRQAVAMNTSTPPEILICLGKSEDARVRYWVARNTATPPDILSNLARDRNSDVCCGCAMNSAAPPEMLNDLASSVFEKVRWGVAMNSMCPPSILVHLFDDNSEDVRCAVAANRLTPHDIFYRLSVRGGDEVRKAVAYNDSAPCKVVMSMAHNENKFVRIAVAHNESLSHSDIEFFEHDYECGVRAAAAENVGASPSFLARRARSSVERIRSATARNPVTPFDSLAKLVQDKEEDVRRCALENPNIFYEDIWIADAK